MTLAVLLYIHELLLSTSWAASGHPLCIMHEIEIGMATEECFNHLSFVGLKLGFLYFVLYFMSPLCRIVVAESPVMQLELPVDGGW